MVLIGILSRCGSCVACLSYMCSQTNAQAPSRMSLYRILYAMASEKFGNTEKRRVSVYIGIGKVSLGIASHS